MDVINFIGWVGSLLLAFCGLPLAIQSFQKKVDYTNRTFLFMWLLGELCLFTYTYASYGLDLPLLSNYVMNILLILVVLRYNRPIEEKF